MKHWKALIFGLALIFVVALPGTLRVWAGPGEALPTDPPNTDASGNSSINVAVPTHSPAKVTATDGESGNGTDANSVIIPSKPAQPDSSSSATDAEGSDSSDTGAASLGGSSGNPSANGNK